jgi:hypothetical protein
MLTLRQIDNVVQSNLFVIKGWEHERQERGGTILYTIWKITESGKILLGVFRVWEWHDGSGRCDWQPLPEITPEQEKLRDFFQFQMVQPLLMQADNSTIDSRMAQAGITAKIKYSNFDPPHHEHIVKAKRDDILKFLNARIKDDYSFIFCHNPESTIEFLTIPETLESGQLHIYAMLHNDAGNEPLGAVIVFDLIEDTLNYKVEFKAICYSENPDVIEYFETLWKALVRFFPAWLDTAEVDNQRLEQGKREPPISSQLADSGGGTVIYRRNVKGQTVIEGGTINPGFRFEVGQTAVAIKSEMPDNQPPFLNITQDRQGKPPSKPEENPKPKGKSKILFESTFPSTPQILADILHDFWLHRASSLEGTAIDGMQFKLEKFSEHLYYLNTYIGPGNFGLRAHIEIRRLNDRLCHVTIPSTRGHELYKGKPWNKTSKPIDRFLLDFGAYLKKMYAGDNETSSLQKPLEQSLPPIYADNLDKVKELSMQGLTVKVIALRLAVSESTVKRYRKELGLQRHKP